MISNHANQVTNARDITVLCSETELARKFIKEFFIVWFDSNLQQDDNNLSSLKKEFEVKHFTDKQEASKFVKNVQTICLIIASELDFIKDVSKLDHVCSIYVFSQIPLNHDWKKESEKIYCVENDFQIVLGKMKENLTNLQREVPFFRFDLPCFAPLFSDWDKNEMNYLHLYLKMFVHFQNCD